MITKNALSKIFYEHDPMGTSCNVNKNMRDEYDSEASHIVQLLSDGVPFRTALHDVFSFFFYDGCLIGHPTVPLIESEYYLNISTQ